MYWMIQLFFRLIGMSCLLTLHTVKCSFLTSTAVRLVQSSVLEFEPVWCQVTALLGVPAPRQSMGSFVEPVLRQMLSTDTRLKHYQDLARQKQTLATKFLTQISESTDSASCYATSYSTEEECVAIVDACLALMASGRDDDLSTKIARNTLLAIALAVVIDVFIIRAIERFTFGSLWTVVGGVCEKKSWLDFCEFVKSRWCCSDDETNSYLCRYKGKHRATFVFSFLFVCVYYAACIFFFLMSYVIYGYWKLNLGGIWDSTYIHTPSVIPIYMACVMCTSGIVLFILHCSIRSFAAIWLSDSSQVDVQKSDASENW